MPKVKLLVPLISISPPKLFRHRIFGNHRKWLPLVVGTLCADLSLLVGWQSSHYSYLASIVAIGLVFSILLGAITQISRKATRQRAENEALHQSLARENEARIKAEQLLRQQNRDIELQQKITSVTNAGGSVEEVVYRCLQHICATMDWDVGHAYLKVDTQANELFAARLWHLENELQFRDFREASERPTFSPEQDLPGQVLLKQQPIFANDLTHSWFCQRAAIAQAAGLVAACGLPILIGREVAGVLEFFHTERIVADDKLQELMLLLGTQIGRFIERTTAENLLRESEARFKQIVEEASDIIYRIDEKGFITFVNPSGINRLQAAHRELLGTHYLTLIHPDHRERASYFYSHQALNQIAQTYNEYLILDARDSYIWLGLNVRLMFEEGKVVGAHAVARDITYQKLAEERLRVSEEQFAKIFESSPSALAIQRLSNLEYLNVNKKWLQLTGLTKEEVIGQPIEQVESWVDPALRAQAHEKLLRGINFNNFEITIRSRSGEEAFGLLSTQLMMVQGEMCVLGVVQDISERKYAEMELNRNEALLRQFVKHTPAAIAMLDTEMRYLQISERWLSDYHLGEQDIIGKSHYEVFPEVPERWKEIHRRVLTGAVERCAEDSFQRLDGTMDWLQWEAQPWFKEGGEIGGIIFFTQVITERKQLELKLLNSQKLESVGQLAAGIAHEINTPTQFVGDNTRFVRDAFSSINLILGKFSELLTAVKAGDIQPSLISALEEEVKSADIDYLSEEIPNAIGQSLEGVTRIANIVRSMKEFAHPGSNDKRSADLNRAIESTVMIARNEWKYIAEIDLQLDKNLSLVPCYLSEFNQVILNMVINATHAIGDVVGDGTKGKGKITISTQKVNEHWAEIRVSDTGKGIPAEIRSRIFDPFFTTKEVGVGTGQGLAISHVVIVEKHKGQIQLESEVGKGTTFIIRLPLNT